MQLRQCAGANGDRDRQVHGSPLVAREPVAQCERRVQRDVHVYIPDDAAFSLQHPVRREVAQAPAQGVQRVAERRR